MKNKETKIQTTSESISTRRHQRIPVLMLCKINGHICTVKNISNEGLLIETTAELEYETEHTVSIDSVLLNTKDLKVRVCWNLGQQFGLRIVSPINQLKIWTEDIKIILNVE